jgi:ribose/xylose/arabinose/galactoside ABC-type transport system permease subunit
MSIITEVKKKARIEFDSRTLNSFSRILILVLLSAGVSFLSPHFLTTKNLINVLTTASVPAILAIAQTMVVLTANIDLSIGAIFAISSVVCAVMINFGDVSFPLAMLAGLGVGGFMGLLNGLMVAKIKLPPFIATYGLMYAATGLSIGILKGYVVYGFPNDYRFIGIGKLINIPMPILIAGIVVLLTWLLMNRTTFGRRVFALGANAEAARMSGINTTNVLIMVYVIAGIIAAFAGMVHVARINAAETNLGATLLMPAIAAVVIGGTSMFGGEGGVGGTVIGALIMTIVQNALTLLGVPSNWQQFILGVIIVVAVLADQSLRRLTANRSTN